MPSQIAHILVGEAALALAAPSLAQGLLGSSRAFLFRLGCQGPDIFYHNQRTRPLALHYGVLAHRRGYGRLVESMADLWLKEDGDPESPFAAYLLGFSTHGALDRIAHPFIVYFAGWVDAARPETRRFRSCHPFLERVLDALLWERLRGTPAASFDSEALLCPPKNFPRGLPERLALSLESAYPSETKRDSLIENRVKNSLADARRFYVLTNPARANGRAEGIARMDKERGLRYVSVLYPRDIPRSVDWANEGGGPWVHPCQGGPSDRRSFFELCDAARDDAAQAVSQVADVLHSRGSTAGVAASIGNGTLNVGDASGRPARPLYSAPLPLREFMEEELKFFSEKTFLQEPK